MRLTLPTLITLLVAAASPTTAFADDRQDRRGSSAENSNRGGELRGQERAEQRHRMKSEKKHVPGHDAKERDDREGAGRRNERNERSERDRARSREHKAPQPAK